MYTINLLSDKLYVPKQWVTEPLGGGGGGHLAESKDGYLNRLSNCHPVWDIVFSFCFPF